MSVFSISLLLEIILVNNISRIRTKIDKEESIKLMIISIIISILTYNIEKEINLFYYLIPIFVHIFYMDIKEYLIINEFNLMISILGLIKLIINFDIFNILINAIFIIIMLVVKLFENIKKIDIIGDGDLKLFISLSLLFGTFSFHAIFVASLLGIIIELLKKILNINKVLIPFGPYLVIGYYLIMVLCF